MKAVVIGGSGQIGGWLLHTLAAHGHEAVGTYASVAYPGLVPLDAADKESAARWLREARPDVVFYPAGFTWVDGCERDEARAYDANLHQPLNLARAAAESGARFVYFSTDYVFDGTTGPNVETDPMNPLSVYGRAKRDAELALERELGDRQLTLRTSWVFGPERQGKNFAYQLVRTLKAGKPIVCPSDQISTPSYGPDVADTAIRMIEAGASGLFHLVGPDCLPRPAFAEAIAAGFGLGTEGIAAKTTAELGQGAPRPLRGGLLCPKLDALLPGAMRPLADAVADFRSKVAGPAPWLDPMNT